MRHWIEYAAVSSIAMMVRILPLAFVRRLGETLGLMFYRVDVVHGRIEDTHGWLTYVRAERASGRR